MKFDGKTIIVTGGGGGIGDIADAGDIATGTAKVDGKFLKFDA